jgi:hypothetical protein
MGHFSFDGDGVAARQKKAFFVQQLLDDGFLASTSFYAMGAHRDQHVTSYLEAVARAFAAIAEADRDGSLERRLRGRPAAVGFNRIN